MFGGEGFIDLTQPIWAGMPYNPDHFPAEIEAYAAIASHGWEATKLTLDSHLGTHLDAPRHFIVGGIGVDQVDLTALIGQAEVVHIDGPIAGRTIGVDELPIEMGERVLLATSWSDQMLGQEDYFLTPPIVSVEAAERFIATGVRLLGIDGPTVDLDGEVHRILLAGGCLILEGLMNLASLGSNAEIVVLPLRLRDGDGSPVRALGRPIDAK